MDVEDPAFLDRFGFGLKLMNSERASEYIASIAAGRGPERFFVLRGPDLRILYLTRKIARLRLSRADYARFFGRDPLEHFAPELEAIERHGLARLDAHEIALTPRGMFYADSVAGLIASHQVRIVRAREARGRRARRDPNAAIPNPMG
jgi:oxygen-independent coproporphyrinogen-3 oxidase